MSSSVQGVAVADCWPVLQGYLVGFVALRKVFVVLIVVAVLILMVVLCWYVFFLEALGMFALVWLSVMFAKHFLWGLGRTLYDVLCVMSLVEFFWLPLLAFDLVVTCLYFCCLCTALLLLSPKLRCRWLAAVHGALGAGHSPVRFRPSWPSAGCAWFALFERLRAHIFNVFRVRSLLITAGCLPAVRLAQGWGVRALFVPELPCGGALAMCWGSPLVVRPFWSSVPLVRAGISVLVCRLCFRVLVWCRSPVSARAGHFGVGARGFACSGGCTGF